MAGSGTGVAAVSRVQPDSAAAAAGIRVGDRVLAVNGDAVAGWAHEEVVALLRAAAERSLRIVVQRRAPGTSCLRAVTLVREGGGRGGGKMQNPQSSANKVLNKFSIQLFVRFLTVGRLAVSSPS